MIIHHIENCPLASYPKQNQSGDYQDYQYWSIVGDSPVTFASRAVSDHSQLLLLCQTLSAMESEREG
jgi:hypothetical protein